MTSRYGIHRGDQCSGQLDSLNQNDAGVGASADFTANRERAKHVANAHKKLGPQVHRHLQKVSSLPVPQNQA
jgi:hypothetical protein